MIKINNIILKKTFLKRYLKKFERRKNYLFLNFKKESERKSERGVKKDLNNNNDRDELSDLIKRVEVIKKIEVEGEVPARPVI